PHRTLYRRLRLPSPKARDRAGWRAARASGRRRRDPHHRTCGPRLSRDPLLEPRGDEQSLWRARNHPRGTRLLIGSAPPSPPSRAEREGPIAKRWEGEVGVQLRLQDAEEGGG